VHVTQADVVEVHVLADALNIESVNLRYPASLNQAGLPQAVGLAMQEATNSVHLQLQQIQETQLELQQQTQRHTQDPDPELQQQTQQLPEFHIKYCQDQLRAFNRQAHGVLQPLSLLEAPEGVAGFPATRTAYFAPSGLQIVHLLDAHGHMDAYGHLLRLGKATRLKRQRGFVAFICVCHLTEQERAPPIMLHVWQCCKAAL
jgi:hypothetical protein